MVNGTTLALGAAGALALLGMNRRGSADRAQGALGPRKPLLPGFAYRAKQGRDGLAVFLYQGTKRVGFLDAYWRYSISSIERESRYSEADPKWHLACFDDLRALGAEGKSPKILAVFGTQLDEGVRGKGAGKALYEALMAEAFDEAGPFFFVPMACWSSRASTSSSALRVWASLARAYPSSGVVVRVDRRPVAGSANRPARGSRSGVPSALADVASRAADLGITLTLAPYSGHDHGGGVVEVTDLVARASGTGAGTRVMRDLISTADEEGVNLILSPSSRRNVDFYTRFGFALSDRAHGMMFRYAEYPEEDE